MKLKKEKEKKEREKVFSQNRLIEMGILYQNTLKNWWIKKSTSSKSFGILSALLLMEILFSVNLYDRTHLGPKDPFPEEDFCPEGKKCSRNPSRLLHP